MRPSDWLLAAARHFLRSDLTIVADEHGAGGVGGVRISEEQSVPTVLRPVKFVLRRPLFVQLV